MANKTEIEGPARSLQPVAPRGLYDLLKKTPFLGRVRCNVDRLVAGSFEEVVLDYEVGASGIADGASVKVTFKFYSDWALFQTSDPNAANYVSAEYVAAPTLPGQSPATLQSLKTRFDQKGHERPFQKTIIIDTVDGYVKPGDHIIIRLGDRRFGGPGTRVQTFVEKGFRLRCYLDPLGTSRFAAIPGDVTLDVVPDRAAELALVGPRLARVGEPLALRVRAQDRWGNTCFDTGGSVRVRWRLDGEQGGEEEVALSSTGWAVAAIIHLPTGAPGELEILASLRDAPAVPEQRFFVRLEAASPRQRIFYADLHVHSDDTVGTNDTVYNLTYGRDVAGLDVLGYTANDFHITAERWRRAVALCRELSRDGEFVCYPGTEWCGNSAVGGDHNVVFLHDRTPRFPDDEQGKSCRSFEWNEHMKGLELQPGTWPIEDLYAAYADDPEGHLLMPHVGGRRCNLDWHHPTLERLIEVGSAWGQFGWLYDDALRRGYQLGVSANSDEHRGRCGGGVPGTAVFGTKGGLTGVIAPELSRAAIARALRARHTFATTGERLVGLTRCGDAIQGEALTVRGAARIAYRFLGDAGWDEIAAFDHSGCIFRRNLQAEAGYSARRIRFRWGGARIPDRYRWAAWKGTVTVLNGTILSAVGRGFEHPEEVCFRAGPTTVGFRSDTFGDADAVEMEIAGLEHCTVRVEGTIDGYVKVGDPAAGNPFVHCPRFAWEVSGKELLAAGGLRRELGGTDLFLAFERLSDAAMPRELTGEIEVSPENGPHGFRPVYVMARQVDDAKVWTSALFITFAS